MTKFLSKTKLTSFALVYHTTYTVLYKQEL